MPDSDRRPDFLGRVGKRGVQDAQRLAVTACGDDVDGFGIVGGRGIAAQDSDRPSLGA